MCDEFYIGIDVGTSGVRAAIVDSGGYVLRTAKSPLAEHDSNRRNPLAWWSATDAVLKQLAIDVPVSAVCVDATSGTVLPVDADGQPLAEAMMYNDVVSDLKVLEKIASVAPATSAVHGASSALARAIVLQRTPGVHRIIHQADWIVGKLSSRFDISDESNSLKTGYDAISRQWPDWLDSAGMDTDLLPAVVPAGTVTGHVSSETADKYQLQADTFMVAGVTDGCASFLATGAAEIGDCVTALGTTITMKMLCIQPMYAPQYGVYSHRIGNRWLAGGASNSGGNVLANYFSDEEISTLSQMINLQKEPPHEYYPLLAPGERFPHNDAHWQPVMSPRPDRNEDFLHGLLVGMTCIEALGYQRLRELGGPALRSIRTVGGGANNDVWTAIRKQHISTSFQNSKSTEAAVGAALLARQTRAESDA